MNILDNVTLKYDEQVVFKDFSLAIAPNKITCILGPSGCGKTSLLHMMAGLVKPNSGQVQPKANKISYVFQDDRLLPWLSVYDNIAIVRQQQDVDQLNHILDMLDLSAVRGHKPTTLSGGMRQRVAIGRAFYYGGALLLMDEPLQSLDYKLKLTLIDYTLKLWLESATTIIYVTHDVDEALLLGHNIVVLSSKPTQIIKTYQRQVPFEVSQIAGSDYLALKSSIIQQL